MPSRPLNLAQQDMLALRVTARFADATANPADGRLTSPVPRPVPVVGEEEIAASFEN